MPAPLWLADISIPLAARLMAFRLLRARIRRAWMGVDPHFLLTTLGVIVTLRIGYRVLGLAVSIPNILTGTAVIVLVLAYALGALTKRGDTRESRATERKLRMLGFQLTRGGRLVANG